MEKMLVTLNELVDPRHAALLVIDVQKDFCLPRLCKWDTSGTDEMMPRLLRLMDAARSAGVKLIHIRMESPQWAISPAWMRRKLTPNGVEPERCQPGTEGAEFMPGFEPLPGEIVVAKHRYSAFIDTNLDLILRSLGTKTIITTGTATNNCVESTARHGYMLDYYLVFPSDGTASYDRTLHEATLTNIRNHFGVVATADEVIACWQQLAAVAEAAPPAQEAVPLFNFKPPAPSPAG